jgi:hypothetical protein
MLHVVSDPRRRGRCGRVHVGGHRLLDEPLDRLAVRTRRLRRQACILVENLAAVRRTCGCRWRRHSNRAVLRGECPVDSRDDVQERDDPSNLEDPFDDRCSPQHDIELAIEFYGVFLRL